MAVSHGDGPAVVVDGVVVVGAEQDQVGQCGGSAVCPVLDVVGVGPARWAVALGERAKLINGDRGTSVHPFGDRRRNDHQPACARS